MRRCLQCLCARLPVGVSFSSSSSLLPAVVSAELRDAAVARLYAHCVNPATSPSDVAQHSTALLPFIAGGQLRLPEQMRVIDVLAFRAIRNEDVILKCLWSVFKAPLPLHDATAPVLLAELSGHTAHAFQLMAEQQFLNDPQMTAIALGRCVELAPFLTLDGLRDTYQGLQAVNHLFFTAAEVAHHSSEVTEQMTTKEFYEQDDTPDADTLRHQPNLIDVLCAQLEARLEQLTAALEEQVATSDDAADTQLVPVPSASHAAGAFSEVNTEPQALLDLMAALSVVGVLHASSLDCLASLLLHHHAAAAPPSFLVHALSYATQIEERVVDPLVYSESGAVQDARRQLTLRLSEEVRRMPNAAGYLRRHPQELLLLRRLFEREAAAASLSPALWDTVRTIRVAHRHATAETQRSTRPDNKLFRKEFAVKVKPISVDDSEAERFVPPEFKTWRSPAVSSHGRHARSGRTPQKMGFGTRRISKNYIQKKRKKYCPAVF